MCIPLLRGADKLLNCLNIKGKGLKLLFVRGCTQFYTFFKRPLSKCHTLAKPPENPLFIRRE